MTGCGALASTDNTWPSTVGPSAFFVFSSGGRTTGAWSLPFALDKGPNQDEPLEEGFGAGVNSVSGALGNWMPRFSVGSDVVFDDTDGTSDSPSNWTV